MTTPKKEKVMWLYFGVELSFVSRFANSAPKHPKDILAMLESRTATDAHLRKMREEGEEEVIPIEQMAEELGLAVDASTDADRGHATFLRDDNGLYYEARCVRAHIKDCANQLQTLLDIKALKAKVSNRVYVRPAKLILNREAIDGEELRIIHAMTPKGPRSSLKTVDFLENAKLSFSLKVLNDGVVDEKLINHIFEYGCEHGMGQERSQDWGRYEYKVTPGVETPA